MNDHLEPPPLPPGIRSSLRGFRRTMRRRKLTEAAFAVALPGALRPGLQRRLPQAERQHGQQGQCARGSAGRLRSRTRNHSHRWCWHWGW